MRRRTCSVLWIYDLSKRAFTGTASSLDKGTYLVVLSFSLSYFYLKVLNSPYNGTHTVVYVLTYVQFSVPDDLDLTHTHTELSISVLLLSWSHLREVYSNRAMEAKVNCSEREIFQDYLACCLPANNPISFSSVFRKPPPYSALDVTICPFFFLRQIGTYCGTWHIGSL